MTDAQVLEKIKYFKGRKAEVDSVISKFKNAGMDVEMAKGKFDEEFNGFLKELMGKSEGEIHLTDILLKIYELS